MFIRTYFSLLIEIGVMTVIEKINLKNQLLELCIKKQQSLLDDFKTRIKSLVEREDLGNEEEYDNTQQANIAQSIAEADGLNNAMSFANQEMIQLEKLKATQAVLQHKAELGAVVVTDISTFFISTSIEQIAAGGETFIGLSVYSPLFQQMKGKSKGQSFFYKGITYQIADIF